MPEIPPSCFEDVAKYIVLLLLSAHPYEFYSNIKLFVHLSANAYNKYLLFDFFSVAIYFSLFQENLCSIYTQRPTDFL